MPALPNPYQVAGIHPSAGGAAMIPGGALDGLASLTKALLETPRYRRQRERQDRLDQAAADEREWQHRHADKQDQRLAQHDDLERALRGADTWGHLVSNARKAATDRRGHFDQAAFDDSLRRMSAGMPKGTVPTDPATGLPSTAGAATDEDTDPEDEDDTGLPKAAAGAPAPAFKGDTPFAGAALAPPKDVSGFVGKNGVAIARPAAAADTGLPVAAAPADVSDDALHAQLLRADPAYAQAAQDPRFNRAKALAWFRQQSAAGPVAAASPPAGDTGLGGDE
jgi:hypothetical protein